MRPDADLSLQGFGRMVAELLERLDLRAVTLVQNDHAAALVLAGERPARVARLVISSCEAFTNYPPGLPGKNLRLAAMFNFYLRPSVRPHLIEAWARYLLAAHPEVQWVQTRVEMLDIPPLAELAGRGWPAFKTSAKTGAGVEDAFLTLARRMVE